MLQATPSAVQHPLAVKSLHRHTLDLGWEAPDRGYMGPDLVHQACHWLSLLQQREERLGEVCHLFGRRNEPPPPLARGRRQWVGELLGSRSSGSGKCHPRGAQGGG